MSAELFYLLASKNKLTPKNALFKVMQRRELLFFRMEIYETQNGVIDLLTVVGYCFLIIGYF
jgi:hypothetical protein